MGIKVGKPSMMGFPKIILKLWKASLEKVLEAVESENVTNSVKNLKGKKEDDKEVVADDGLRMLIMRMGDIYLQKLYLTNVS